MFYFGPHEIPFQQRAVKAELFLTARWSDIFYSWSFIEHMMTYKNKIPGEYPNCGAVDLLNCCQCTGNSRVMMEMHHSLACASSGLGPHKDVSPYRKVQQINNKVLFLFIDVKPL